MDNCNSSNGGQRFRRIPRQSLPRLKLDPLVEDLAHLSFQTAPIYVDVDDGITRVTNEGLQQGYCVVPSAMRFLLLYSFLKRNLSKKVMVFFSSCNSVKFHSELLTYIQVEYFDIHGKQKQQKRTTTFFDSCKAKKGILLCTDVAARGLDIPSVDWIVQYDPPDEPKEYIHKVGRTACGEGGKGNALLFLILEELKFLKYLKGMYSNQLLLLHQMWQLFFLHIGLLGRRCIKITDDGLQQILSKCLSLRSLNLYAVSMLTDKAYKKISNAALLSFLDLCGAQNLSDGLSCIATCKNLTSLNLTWCVRITDMGVIDVAESCIALEFLSTFRIIFMVNYCQS